MTDPAPADPYTRWCLAHGCEHGHCESGCDKPQPVGLPDGRLVCGRCLIPDGIESGMEPCDPDHC